MYQDHSRTIKVMLKYKKKHSQVTIAYQGWYTLYGK